MMWGESPNDLKHLSLCGNDTHLPKINSRRNTIVEDIQMLKEMNISIICSHVEFRVVTKKLRHFQNSHVRYNKSKGKANKASWTAACSMSWGSPSRLWRWTAKCICEGSIPRPRMYDTGASNQLRQHHQCITFCTDSLYLDNSSPVYTTPMLRKFPDLE